MVLVRMTIFVAVDICGGFNNTIFPTRVVVDASKQQPSRLLLFWTTNFLASGHDW